MKLTRVSNAGLLLELGEKRYLFDALNTDEVPPYYATDPALYRAILQGADADLIFTHAHPDHFNAVMTMEYLAAHPASRVYGPAPVREKLALCGIPNSRMVAAEELTMHPDRPVSAFRTLHIGAPYRHVVHYSYFIGGKESLLFVGDTTPIKDNYREFTAVSPTLTVLAANYAHIIGSGSRMLTLLNPAHTVVLHLPNPQGDENHLIEMTADAAAKLPQEITLMQLKGSITH